MVVKKNYIKPFAETVEMKLSMDILLEGSYTIVPLTPPEEDIPIGDDEESNVFTRSLWDEE